MQVQRLINAGKDLIKGDFNTALKSFTPDPVYVSPIDYRPSIATDSNWFYEMNGQSVFHFKYSGHNSSQKAYECCPPVNAIVNKKAQSFINGKTWVLNTQGKAKGKVSNSEEAKKIQALFEKPNPLQS